MPNKATTDKNKPSLTILMLLDTIQIGGTETHVMAVAKQLMAKGHRVIVGTSGGPYVDAFQKAGIEIVTMPFQTDDPIRKELTDLLQQVRALIAEEGVDLIHAHLIGGMKIASLIAEETGIPFVMTIHGLYYPIWQLQRYIHSCHHVIAVSHPVAKWLQQRIPETRRRMTLIQNGVDTAAFSPGNRDNEFRRKLGVPLDETLILSCGRIAWGKTRVLAVAMESLLHVANSDKVHLAVVGSGPDLPLIRAIASMVNRQLNREAVRFLGELKSGLVNMYRAADIVIGSARVALETMSCGRPLIAAGNAGYVGLVAEDNLQQAWEVYFGDHSGLGPPNSARVAEDLSRLISNPKALAKPWRVNRRWVHENFNIQSVTTRIEEVYRHVLKPASSAEVRDKAAALHAISVPKASPLVTETETEPIDVTAQLLRKAVKSAQTKDGQKPLISVVVPAYNPGHFLDACLKGLFEQSYEPLEIIVIDDASTDNTAQIVRKWLGKSKKTKRRTVLYHRLPTNVGFAHALSVGYFLASGHYIANHDADDVSHPKRIESQYNFLLENDDCHIVGTNYEVFSNSLANRKKSHLVKYGHAVEASYREGKHCVCFGSLLFHRAVRDRLGGLTSYAEGAEDYEFVARAITQGFKVDNIKEVLYYYRSHAKQRSRAFYSVRSAFTDTVSFDAGGDNSA